MTKLLDTGQTAPFMVGTTPSWLTQPTSTTNQLPLTTNQQIDVAKSAASSPAYGQSAGASLTGGTKSSITGDPHLNLAGIQSALQRGVVGNPMPEATPTSLSYNQLVAGGLSPLQAQTRLAGFTGEFGGGAAKAFREQNPVAFLQAVSATRDMPITEFMAGNVRNPSLPNGAAFTPSTQSAQPGELLTSTPIQSVLAQMSRAQEALAEAGITDPEEVQSILDTIPRAMGYLTGGAEQMQAQQGQVNQLSTVAGQLQNLLSGDNPQVSRIFDSAIAKVSGEMSARGLGNSTLAADAIIEAVSRQALPIAAQDAATYFQMDMANLNNQQQAALENTRLRQQSLLTDVSIQNATEQFNATNETQRQQFIASLVTQIKDQNASRATQVSQFNAAQKTQTSISNAQMEQAVSQFNASVENQRNVFNAQNQFAVDQSNALWRRTLNTQNTAAQNAAMQANVQNMFNMSATAQNNLWQQFRDESAWAYQSAEAALNRNFQAAQAANNRQFQSRNDNNWLPALGSFAASLFS